MRKFVCAASVVVLALSFVVAEESFNAKITKIDGNKVTVSKKKKGEDKATELTFALDKDVKVVTGKFVKKKLEEGDAVEKALANTDIFSMDKLKEGVSVRVTIDTKADDEKAKITKIVVLAAKKKATDK